MTLTTGAARRVIGLATWAVALVAALPVSGAVVVESFQAGFPLARVGRAMRAGAWVPVVAEFSLQGEPAFDGLARVSQIDRDGDVCYDSVVLHLRGDDGGPVRHFLYIPASVLRNDGEIALEVLRVDEAEPAGAIVDIVYNGEVSRSVGLGAPLDVVDDSSLFILEVSSNTASRLSELDPSLYTRPPVTAHIDPGDLPELWIGLEMVDVVLWEDARITEESPNLRQLEALLEWTRQGGTLIICSGRYARQLAQSEQLEPALPVTVQDVATATALPKLHANLLYPESARDRWASTNGQLTGSVPVALCEQRSGADVLLYEPGLPSDLITARSLERGRLVFVGLSLRDLFSAARVGSAQVLFENLLQLQKLTDATDQYPGGGERSSLFSKVADAVAFAPNVGFYLLVALLFSLGYAGVATLGSWAFLRGRGWSRHNWTSFALVAVAASGLSLVAVKTVQGVTSRVHQLVIVDADAGSRYGNALALFGLKTASDTRLDVWLPDDYLTARSRQPGATNCFLRPLGESSSIYESRTGFVDPVEYDLVPSEALVHNVRLRSTLKRFEGRWEGPLAGTVSGRLAVRQHGGPYDLYFTDDSYLVNDLDVDLHDCYLIHTAADAYDAPTETQGAWLRPLRDLEIYVYELGTLPAGGVQVHVAPLCYKLQPNEKSELDAKNRQALGRRHEEWSRPLVTVRGRLRSGLDVQSGYGLPRQRQALLLLSTLGEWNPVGHKAQWEYFWPGWDRLRWLDLRDHLRRDTAILVGFADDPGPVRLATRRASSSGAFRQVATEAEPSWTMYRFRVPVQNVPRQRRGATVDPDEDHEPSLLEQLGITGIGG